MNIRYIEFHFLLKKTLSYLRLTLSSLTRTHSYPSSPSPGTSLGGSQTQLSLDSVRESPKENRRRTEEEEEEEEEEEWGGVLVSSCAPAESKTGSLLLLER